MADVSSSSSYLSSRPESEGLPLVMLALLPILLLLIIVDDLP